ncbi:MAG TPA: GNAT family N-acetyltransferase [Armatimonadaceae bacterium]|nr:GNAT family N-acetyltransferase [Armatimonadaceae bacterium]
MPFSSLQIRPARYDDAAAIHAVTQAAYGEYAETATPSMATSETERYVADSLGEGAFRAAVGEEGGRVVAAVRYKVTGEGLFFFRLAVHPEWRRRGVARAMVEWLAAEAVRHHTNRLRCQVRMLVGRNVDLYRSLGFEVTDTHTIIRNGNPVPVASMERRVEQRTALPPPLAGAAAETND